MSFSNRKQTAFILSVTGLAAIFTSVDASAHGFGGGRSGFGGGHMSFGGRDVARYMPVRFNPGRAFVGHRGPITIDRPPPPIRIVHRIPIDDPCLFRHSCGPKPPSPPPITCRWHPNLAFCHGWPPIVVRQPPGVAPPIVVRQLPGIAPPVVVGQAPVTLATASATPALGQVATAASTCALPDAPIAVVFQPTATASDITTFLTSYNAKIGNGPDQDRVYRIRLEDGNLTVDQYAQILQSMRSQTTIVSTVGG